MSWMTPKRKEAQMRNWRVLLLRGAYGSLVVGSTSRYAAALGETIDMMLEELGAVTERQKRAQLEEEIMHSIYNKDRLK